MFSGWCAVAYVTISGGVLNYYYPPRKEHAKHEKSDQGEEEKDGPIAKTLEETTIFPGNPFLFGEF